MAYLSNPLTDFQNLNCIQELQSICRRLWYRGISTMTLKFRCVVSTKSLKYFNFRKGQKHQESSFCAQITSPCNTHSNCTEPGAGLKWQWEYMEKHHWKLKVKIKILLFNLRDKNFNRLGLGMVVFHRLAAMFILKRNMSNIVYLILLLPWLQVIVT